MKKRFQRFGALPAYLQAGVICLTLVSAGCGTLQDDALPNGTSVPGSEDGWAAQVLQVSYGDDATFGQGSMPGVVLGPSNGTGTGAQSLDESADTMVDYIEKTFTV